MCQVGVSVNDEREAVVRAQVQGENPMGKVGARAGEEIERACRPCEIFCEQMLFETAQRNELGLGASGQQVRSPANSRSSKYCAFRPPAHHASI